MKGIRIFLLVLIIIGIALLATHKVWVPKLVDQILLSEDVSVAPIVSTTTTNSVSNGTVSANWKTYKTPDSYNLTLEYPPFLSVDEDVISDDWPLGVSFFDPNNNDAEYLLVQIYRLGISSDESLFISADEYVSLFEDDIIMRSAVYINGRKMTHIKLSTDETEHYLIEHGKYLYVVLLAPEPDLQEIARTMLQSFKID